MKQSLCRTLVLLLCAMSFCLLCYPQGTQDSKSVKQQGRPLPPSDRAQLQANPTPGNQVVSTPPNEEPTASPNLSAKTADGLKWFFTVLVYPAVVGGVFLLLICSIIYIIGQGQGFGYVRRTTGALLPLLLLTFMLLVTDKADDPVKSFFLNRNPFIYVFVGLVLGIALVELGKRLIRTDDDRWGSIYNLFLSFMFVFLLYSIMKGFLDSLIYFLFSMIMSGGLDIIFGEPMESKARSARSSLFAGRTSIPKRERLSYERDSAAPDFESRLDPLKKDKS